jgi:hypothetical protein
MSKRKQSVGESIIQGLRDAIAWTRRAADPNWIYFKDSPVTGVCYPCAHGRHEYCYERSKFHKCACECRAIKSSEAASAAKSRDDDRLQTVKRTPSSK